MLEVVSTTGTARDMFRHMGVFDNAELTVTYAVDRAEHEARVQAGVAAFTDEFLLAALLSVPDDRLGPVESRFDRVLRRSASARAATVLDDPEGGTWAQRRIRSAVDILGIEISSQSLRRGCSVAHRWAGYGPRTVHSPVLANTMDLTEASHYGIGFVVGNGEHVLPPAPFVPHRWSSARWRFAELVYGQFRELLG